MILGDFSTYEGAKDSNIGFRVLLCLALLDH